MELPNGNLAKLWQIFEIFIEPFLLVFDRVPLRSRFHIKETTWDTRFLSVSFSSIVAVTND